LRAQGEHVGKARGARLMRESGLQGRPRRASRPRTTQRNHAGPLAPNRLADLPVPTARDQAWQADITYVSTAEGLRLHSDRGVQYANERFRAQLAANGLTASLSRRGNCHDHARAEAFFSTLKLELVYRRDFAGHAQARAENFEWIEAFYPLRRRHSSSGNVSPIAFENPLN
jgi:transposase InsO family protein